MHGNVCEWCVDEFFPELKGGIDPVGSDPENPYGCRVVRGGSYCSYDDYEDADVKDYRAANRWLDLPSQRWANFGFRVAIVPSNEEEESDQDGVDETEEEAVTFADLKSELWEVANEKKQALEPALASVSEAGHVIEVALPQETVIQFCSIPAGSFTMGSPEDEEGRVDGEEDQAKVVLTKTFWLAKTPLTQRQWEAVVGTNPSEFKGPDLPVENVSWNEAQAFINKINEQEILPSGWKFALPTEAQWEYACRAGEHGSYSGGKMEEVGWCEENSAEQTHEVGQKKPNHWGLYDMHGNVWEWCADWYENRLKGGTDPAGPSSGIFRVRRGGAWCTNASFCRAARRFGNSPGLRCVMLGFRPALVPSR
jgi:formylglycine-generating enzyme required for sulfatase activity